MREMAGTGPAATLPAAKAAGRRGRLLAGVAAGILFLWPIMPARAEAPAVVIASAPLVAPATASAYYNNPTSPAAPATRDPLIQEMARSLRYDIDLIYEHVRDRIETVPIFGVQKGARGIVLDQRGTPFDQAQFMVEALRESDAVAARGYNPKYHYGRITLTAAQFAAWTGVSDAAVATKLLANGGIPATVTGSGTSFTVTMNHVWVGARIAGTDYLFDPSYKPRSARAGIDWQTPIQYSRANLLASGGGVTGSGVSGFNGQAFDQTLNTYRANLEANLAANSRGKRADAVVGDVDIVPHTTAEDRRTTLPYVAATEWTWTQQIPNVFRHAFSVALNGTTYGTYYADTVGGTALTFNYSNPTGTSVFVAGSVNTSPSASIVGRFDSACDQYLGNTTAAGPAVATVTINHPYAASGGTYGDRTLSKPLVSQRCAFGKFYVSNDWGHTGTGIVDRIRFPAARLRNDPINRLTMAYGPTLANVASQYSSFLDLASQAKGHLFQLHSLIGVHTLDNVAMKLEAPQSQYDMHTMLTMDFEGTVSAMSNGGPAAADSAAAFLAGLGLSFVETAVPRQETDAVYDMAALSLVMQQDQRATPTGTYTTFLVTPVNWQTVRNSLSGYPLGATNAIQEYVNEGYSLLVPQRGNLRQIPISVPPRISRLWEGWNENGDGGELVRSAFLAWRPSAGTGTAPNRLALVVYDPRHGRILKAGVGVAIESLGDTIRKPEAPKAESRDVVRSAMSVDGRSGALTYSPPPDLVDGAGDFPLSLSLRRVYDQREGENVGFGIGWKSNWTHTVTLSNDGNALLGRGGAQALAPALVAIHAIDDLVTTQSAQNLYAALRTAAWLGEKGRNNAAVVESGLDGPQTFYAQQSGTFVPGSANGTTLVQSGLAPAPGIINRWIYAGVDFTYTGRDGSTRFYESPEPQLPAQDMSSPGISGLFARKTVRLDNWAFPNGVKIDVGYTSYQPTLDVFRLFRVSNNLGFEILNSFYDYGSTTEVWQCTGFSQGTAPTKTSDPRDARATYRTSTNASVSLVMDAQAGFQILVDPAEYRCSPGSQPPTEQSQHLSHARSFTDAVGATWAYGQKTADGLYGGYAALGQVYKPGQASPAIDLTFGKDSNVRRATDLAGNSWDYFASPFRFQALTPLQAAAASPGSITYYDRYGQPVRQIDPLGRISLTEFDDFGRVSRRINPEGDGETSHYDARGNVVKVDRNPKTGTGLAPLSRTFTYSEGPTATVCAAPVTCNKPLTETDARGNTTNYAWDSFGNLTSITRPADASGNRPVTSFGYSTNLFGNDGTVLRLPISETQLISPGVSTTTTYARDAANKFAISSATVDPAGLNLRTCVKFDPAGNVISLSDPRQTSCP